MKQQGKHDESSFFVRCSISTGARQCGRWNDFEVDYTDAGFRVCVMTALPSDREPATKDMSQRFAEEALRIPPNSASALAPELPFVEHCEASVFRSAVFSIKHVQVFLSLPLVLRSFAQNMGQEASMEPSILEEFPLRRTPQLGSTLGHAQARLSLPAQLAQLGV